MKVILCFAGITTTGATVWKSRSFRKVENHYSLQKATVLALAPYPPHPHPPRVCVFVYWVVIVIKPWCWGRG